MFTLAKTDKGTVIEIGLNVSGPDYDDVLKSSAQYSHLITSAPELLESLEDCVILLETQFPNPAPNGQINRARAAIAKALG